MSSKIETATTKKAAKSSALVAVESGMIDALLRGLDDETVADPVTEADIEAAVAGAEEDEARHELYSAQPAGSDVVEPVVVEAKPVKVKAKSPKKVKEPAAPRIFFANRSDRIKHNLGGKVSDFLVLELSDIALSSEALKARQDEILGEIDNKLAKKVGEKAAQLLDWFSKGGKMNEVMRRAFTVLVKDGELTSGDGGNLQNDLLAKPYSMGTARSQANQMFMLFPFFKITVKEKGKMVANPNSVMLAKAKDQLGL